MKDRPIGDPTFCNHNVIKMLKVIIAAFLFFVGAHCATVSVNVVGNTFVPAVVNANVGDVVSWTGLGASHNVAQVADETALANEGFRSGAIGAVPTFETTIDASQAGSTLFYICEAHVSIGMRGKIDY